MFGRFIEIGKRDIEINTKLEMTPFIRNVTFASIDLTVIFRHRKPLGAAALNSVMDLLRENKVHEISPITTYPVSQIEDAFRVMQAGKHLGKLIITAGADDLVKVLPKSEETLQLPADASYLLVGGLGGLGRATSAWLAEHGAKNLIFVSRSGTSKPEAAALVESLEKNAVNVAVLRCDVSDYEKLSAGVHDALKTMPPIRGLIHGGMVLNVSSSSSIRIKNVSLTITGLHLRSHDLCSIPRCNPSQGHWNHQPPQPHQAYAPRLFHHALLSRRCRR